MIGIALVKDVSSHYHLGRRWGGLSVCPFVADLLVPCSLHLPFACKWD